MAKKKTDTPEPTPAPEPTELEKVIAELTVVGPQMQAAKGDRGEYLRIKKRFDWLIEERDRLKAEQ